MENEQFYENTCNALKNFYIEKETLYRKTCNRLKLFYSNKEKKRLRGFNDFNFISLLKSFDDENTHSKIIAEFLNPQGSHYQKELFLEKFFEILNFNKDIKEWEIYTEFFVRNVTGKGQGRIDIFFINDKENKFIILENKIWANDQDSQIYKYVEYLYSDKDFSIKDYNDILVLYLTPFKKVISASSLDNYKVEGKCLVDTISNEKKALFKNITYEKEILEWVELCLEEIENISNLRESLKQYQKAVKYITNKEEDIMSLEEYLKKLLEGSEEDKEVLKTLIVDFDNFKKFADKDKECSKIIEEEKLSEKIEKFKKYIRKKVIELFINNLKDYANHNDLNILNIEDFLSGSKEKKLILQKNQTKYYIYFSQNNFQHIYYGKDSNNPIKFEEPFHGMWQKEFYENVLEQGLNDIADYYFKKLLNFIEI